MTHIGGFFELEPVSGDGADMHASALALHNGRACLMVMLSDLSPRRVWVPHYTCDATLQPFRETGCDMRFYAIGDRFEPLDIPPLQEGEYLLYTNYFGLCERAIDDLKAKLGDRLLVDDTHAFFRGRREGLWSFTSARKYFGVPDGAYLYAPKPLALTPQAFEAISTEHLRLRQEGRQAEAFAAYQRYERSLDTRVFGISDFSRERLSHIDYAAVAAARRHNFMHLDQALSASNRLKLPLEASVPFCYPYLPVAPVAHARLYERGIYPPKLWADMLERDVPAWERELAETLLPLPVDHRYGTDAMDAIVDALGVSR